MGRNGGGCLGIDRGEQPESGLVVLDFVGQGLDKVPQGNSTFRGKSEPLNKPQAPKCGLIWESRLTSKLS